jgi:hypothetical protein
MVVLLVSAYVVSISRFLEYGRKVLAIEVKQTNRPGYRDANGLQAFLQDHPDAVGGLLLHGGVETRWLGEHILDYPGRR